MPDTATVESLTTAWIDSLEALYEQESVVVRTLSDAEVKRFFAQHGKQRRPRAVAKGVAKNHKQEGLGRAVRKFRKEKGRNPHAGDAIPRAWTAAKGSTNPDNFVKCDLRADLLLMDRKRYLPVPVGGSCFSLVSEHDAFLPLSMPALEVRLRVQKPSTRGVQLGETENQALKVFFKANVACTLLGLGGEFENETEGRLRPVLPTKDTSDTILWGGAVVTLAGVQAEIDGNLYYPAHDTSVVVEAKKLPHLLTEINKRQVGLSTLAVSRVPDRADTVRTLFVQVVGDVCKSDDDGVVVDYADTLTFVVHEISVPDDNFDEMVEVGAWKVVLELS